MKQCFLLLLCSGFFYFGHAQTTTPDKRPWLTLNDSIYHLRYPNDWELDQSGRMGSRFFLFAPTDNASDIFRENVNLIVSDLSPYPGVTLDEIAEASREQILSMISDVNIQEFKEEKQGPYPFYTAEYTGKQNELDLHWRQHFLLADNNLYVLTFTAEEGQYKNYIALAERILASFSPKKQ